MTRRRHSLNRPYKDDFFTDYCSYILTGSDNYPGKEELFSFVKFLKVLRPDHNGHGASINRIFEILFEKDRIQDFTDDFFLRVVFFSSPIKQSKNLPILKVGNRSKPMLQYSKENIESTPKSLIKQSVACLPLRSGKGRPRCFTDCVKT